MIRYHAIADKDKIEINPWHFYVLTKIIYEYRLQLILHSIRSIHVYYVFY